MQNYPVDMAMKPDVEAFFDAATNTISYVVAFDDARMKFDVRFYLVSILFIIFDLEVAFLFPWATSFQYQGMLGFWSMMIFLVVLTIGFAYEWKKGALEWE